MKVVSDVVCKSRPVPSDHVSRRGLAIYDPWFLPEPRCAWAEGSVSRGPNAGHHTSVIGRRMDELGPVAALVLM